MQHVVVNLQSLAEAVGLLSAAVVIAGALTFFGLRSVAKAIREKNKP